MAEKDHSERVQELMNHPKNIRNIGIVSHIHHGKCVTGSSRIALADGSFIAAAEFYKRVESRGKVVKSTPDETVIDIRHLGIKAPSFSKDSLKFVEKDVEYVWKLKGGKVLRVKPSNGSEITTTPEHKFIVFDGTDFREVPAAQLKPGDSLVCPRNLSYNELPFGYFKGKLLQVLAKDYGFYAKLDEKTAKEMRNKILAIGLQHVHDSVKPRFAVKTFYSSCVYHGRYRISDLVKIAELLHIDLETIYDSIENVNYRSNTRSSVDMKLPSDGEQLADLLYITGLLYGDGSRGSLTNTDPVIQRRFVEICQRFGFKNAKVADYGYGSPTIRSGGGLTFLKLLESAFGYPLHSKAGAVGINSLISMLPKRALAAFLRGYFDTDGGVEWSRRAITLTSKSTGIIKDLQLILLKFGCVATRDENTIYISGQSAIRFAEQIGFSIDRKAEQLIELLHLVKSSKNTDVVPVNPVFLEGATEEYANYSNGQITPSFFSLQKMAVVEGMSFVRKILEGDVCFLRVREISEAEEDIVYDFTVADTHNFVAEGVVVNNTTLTDNLAAISGMMAAELVGDRMLTWIDDQERERLMTIYGATVTMAHTFNNEKYLINLLDTPGHVDFGGDVTRAMRAVDGAVVMVCAVEGIMPQTETVLKQALAERVKPVLFINKVDRAIKELQLTPEALQQRLEKIVIEVNRFVRNHVEPQFADKWAFSVKDGSVAFGSALRKWAISVPFMKRSGVTFKEIIEACASGKDEALAQKAPMYTVVLDMVIMHLPSPLDAQPYRIPRVWKGDLESTIGKQMVAGDQNGKLGAVITKVVQDPHAGLISTVRIFSGRIVAGQNVYCLGLKKQIKVQQVTTFIADKRQPVQYATAGNVVGLVGLNEASIGETLCEADAIIDPFEEIKHIFEPVVTKAIEPKRPQDLPKLIEILRILGKEDTTLKIEINQETGQMLVSGLGELHLDAKVERKIREKGIDIQASTPIVVYRETCTKKAGPVEGKSPNRHNAFYVEVEPLPKAVYQAMINGVIPSTKELKKKDQAFIDKLRELGISKDDTDGLEVVYERNLLIDSTKGIQYLNEAMELIKQSFKEVANEGPLGREPCTGLIIRITDAKLHEDAIHRGPAQVIPAVRQAIKNAVLMGGATLFEPRQIILINSDHDNVGGVMKEVQSRRGEVLDVTTELGSTNVKAKMPVSEMFGFEAALKSATGGRGFYSLMEQVFEVMPREMLERTVMQIRARKGLPQEMPRPELG